MPSVVMDSGALDALLEERIRRAMAEAARDGLVRLVVPATVIAEFIAGHARRRARADRVLAICEKVSVTPEIGLRAGSLLAAARAASATGPSVVDAILAVFGEDLGAVATTDRTDLEALSGAGAGFDVYDSQDLFGATERRR